MIAIDQVFIICLCCHWHFLCDLQLTERNENLIEFFSSLAVCLWIGMLKHGDIGPCQERVLFLAINIKVLWISLKAGTYLTFTKKQDEI